MTLITSWSKKKKTKKELYKTRKTNTHLMNNKLWTLGYVFFKMSLNQRLSCRNKILSRLIIILVAASKIHEISLQRSKGELLRERLLRKVPKVYPGKCIHWNTDAGTPDLGQEDLVWHVLLHLHRTWYDKVMKVRSQGVDDIWQCPVVDYHN